MKHPVFVTAAFASVFIGTGAHGAQCPTAIRESLPSWHLPGQPKPVFTSMASIHEAMLRCPDIEILQVRTAVIGCSGWPDRFNFPFDIRGGERYAAAPSILSLDGYEPDTREYSACRAVFSRPWNYGLSQIRECLQHRRLPKDQRYKTNLDLWLDAMDFSRIHTLQLNHTRGWYALTAQVAQKLPARLTSLTSLAVHNAIAEQFILALPDNSLSHLSWRNSRTERGQRRQSNSTSGTSLQRVLQHHGSALRSLAYWSDESSSYAPPGLSVEDLHMLAARAPNLSALTLNLRRDDNGTHGEQEWPWKKLKVLAEGLPDLTDLTIYFTLASECHRQQPENEHWSRNLECEGECVGTDKYAQPLLNKTSAADMARLLWQHNTGHRLSSVTFRAGDWTPPWDGPLAEHQWLESQRVWVSCTRDNTFSEGQSHLGDIVCKGGDTLAIREWEKRCRRREQAIAWEEQEVFWF